MSQKKNFCHSTNRARLITCEHRPNTAGESRRRWRSSIRCTVLSVLFIFCLGVVCSLCSHLDHIHFNILHHSTDLSLLQPSRAPAHSPPPALLLTQETQNMIRQYTYLSSYTSPPPGFNISPDILRTHIDHCIETLRRSLMCTADITPMPIKADPDAPTNASADFSTHHKCRKWTKLTAWMEENEVRVDE